jgi:hypothetical protein
VFILAWKPLKPFLHSSRRGYDLHQETFLPQEGPENQASCA